MKLSLFTVSYRPDAEWLAYCRAAVEKYASGFEAWHIVTPSDGTFTEVERLNRFHTPRFPIRWHIVNCPSGLTGHNHQQALKLRADEFCTEADAIVYLDSDIIANRPFTPENFFHLGKLVMEYCHPSHAIAQGVDPRWIANAAKVLNQPTRVEAMRNSGIVHNKNVIRWCREAMERTMGVPVDEIFKHFWDSKTNWFPDRGGSWKAGKPTLSEFITLGSFAYNKCHHVYSWRDILQTGYRELPFRRFWSHSGVTEAEREELRKLIL